MVVQILASAFDLATFLCKKSLFLCIFCGSEAGSPPTTERKVVCSCAELEPEPPPIYPASAVPVCKYSLIVLGRRRT